MIKIRGTGGQTPEYVAPKLFPDSKEYPSHAALRGYLVGCLEDMVDEGTLCFTDVINQGSRIRDAVGMILHGVKMDRGNNQLAAPAPPKIANYKVKLRSLQKTKEVDGELKTFTPTIKFKLGVEPAGNARVNSQYSGTVDGSGYVEKMEDVWLDTETTEEDLPAREAWICLTQHGKYCKPAKRKGLQDRYWTVIEATVADRIKNESKPKIKRKAA